MEIKERMRVTCFKTVNKTLNFFFPLEKKLFLSLFAQTQKHAGNNVTQYAILNNFYIFIQ